MPRANQINDIPNEAPYKGRFFLTMCDFHLKIIDTENDRLFDLLSEPSFDQESVNGLALARSLNDRKNKLLILCHGDDGVSYIQRIDFNAIMPVSLN